MKRLQVAAVRRRLIIAFALSTLGVAHAGHSPPALSPDLAVTGAGQSVLIPVLANDGAPDAGLKLVRAFGAQHGRLKVVGDAVLYTPQRGFAGEECFSYTVRRANGRTVSGEVTVGVGKGAQIELRGVVVDSPIRNARVRVALNGFDFDAWTDAQGAYALRVASLTAAGFVIARAIGASDTGAAVDFRSALGDFRRLAQEAGPDGLLVAGENGQVNITNLSTAQYVLMTRINAGDPPADDAELRSLAETIDSNRLLELAAIIHLVIDEGAPLPAGVNDAFELISDPDAVLAFKASVGAAVIDAAVAEVRESPFLPGFSAASLDAIYAIITPGAPGTIRIGAGVPYWVELDDVAAGAGDGRLWQYFPDDTPAMSWRLGVDGELIVTPASSPVWDGAELDECGFGGQRAARYAMTELALRRLFDGPGADQILLTETVRVVFPEAPGCPPRAPETQIFQRIALAYAIDAGGELPFAAPPPQFALAVYRPELWLLEPWGYELYDFAGAPSSPATWRLENGRLYVNQPGGRLTEYIRLQTDGAAGHGVLAIATLPGGARAVSYDLSVARDGTLAFDANNLAALWRHGFDLSQYPGDGTPEFGFFIRLDANGSGRHEFVNADGTCGGAGPIILWRIEDGDMRATRLPGGNNITRRWTPLARVGARIYVIEEIEIDPGTPFAAADQRPNFYEPQSLPSACGTP
jgi:hypothetical protein